MRSFICNTIPCDSYVQVSISGEIIQNIPLSIFFGGEGGQQTPQDLRLVPSLLFALGGW